jgi:2-iminoacetate synthase
VALENPSANDTAAEQFEISDPRSPSEIASLLRQNGYEPVWKDWDQAILAG